MTTHRRPSAFGDLIEILQQSDARGRAVWDDRGHQLEGDRDHVRFPGGVFGNAARPWGGKR